MARAKGYLAIIGRKKAATWGTAVACAANNGMQLTSIETAGNLTFSENNGLNSTVQRDHGIPGNVVVSVKVQGNLRYEDQILGIMAMVMGTAGAPTTVDTSGKQHVFKVKADTDGLFDSVAYEILKDTKVFEIPAVKWTSFTIRGRSGQPIEFSAEGIGDNLVTNSAVNTTVTIDTITGSANMEIAHFKHAVFYMNAQTGADFAAPVPPAASTDDPGVVGFELTVSRGHEAVFSTLRPGLSVEPRPTGFFEVSGSIDFQDLDGTRNFGHVDNQLTPTAQKAKLVLTGATLCGSATQKYQFNFWLPYVRLGEGKPGVPGPEGQTWSIPFKSEKVPTIPTGFTATYVDAVTIDAYNKLTTDFLA